MGFFKKLTNILNLYKNRKIDERPMKYNYNRRIMDCPFSSVKPLKPYGGKGIATLEENGKKDSIVYKLKRNRIPLGKGKYIPTITKEIIERKGENPEKLEALLEEGIKEEVYKIITSTEETSKALA